MNQQLACSLGIIVYKEAAQIDQLLTALLNQHLHRVEIAEVIVVVSDCDDQTIAMIQKVADQNPKVQIMAWTQKQDVQRIRQEQDTRDL